MLSMTRLYRILLLLMLVPFGAALTGCDDANGNDAGKQVIMLGFDGLDPKLCQRLLDEGRLPNFARLAARGSFLPLRTSTPPHSPVAWSSIITGADPGEHGIFDWIHREPADYMPYLCTTKTTTASGLNLPLGDWKFPLTGGGEVLNLRFGTPFWEHLTGNGVSAHVYRIPANYPPQESPGPGEFLTLTDMGTPDLVGSVGEFSFYTTGPFEGGKSVSGGKIHRIRTRPIGGNVARGSFYGPPDGLLNVDKVGKKQAGKPLEVPFTIYRDKDNRSAVIEWQGNRVLLREREWSDWQTVEFNMGPGVGGVHVQTIRGLIRMHLRQVQPTIELYVSPIQVKPDQPALPVSMPDAFSAEVSDAIGPYYTQGLPEDTQALRHKVLTRDEFLEQADLIYQERLRLLDFALGRFKQGFLFFYFGDTDQIAHMFWSAMADSHPALTPEESEKYKEVMPDVYIRADKVVGKVMKRFPQATILCISDHGFADFARGFNLNTWLIDNGYAAVTPGASRRDFMSFDWSCTRSYGMGINGLYINLRGREGQGIVEPSQKQALMDEIAAKLLQVRDEETGRQVIKEVYQAHKVFTGPRIDIGPDMVIGYDRGYRGSWSTALGGAPVGQLLEDNVEAWCSDHCIATDLVPGVIFSNRPVKLENPTIEDLAPTILREFGIAPSPVMKGGSVFEKGSRPAAG